MAKYPLPSPELLRQLLHYDPETGELTWRYRNASHFQTGARDPQWRANNWNSKNAGRPALATIDGFGYKFGAIFGRLIRAHRVIWAIMTGEWPSEDIDHLNGLKTDNRWCNLRHVSHTINSRNQKLRSTNKSGVNGVRWRADCGKWRAEITVNGKNSYLGHFSDLEDAVAARRAAEAGHGFTDRHGAGGGF